MLNQKIFFRKSYFKERTKGNGNRQPRSIYPTFLTPWVYRYFVASSFRHAALFQRSLALLCYRCRKNQACNLLWLIHLHKMPSPWQEKQIRCGKHLVERLCHPLIQVRIAVTENDSK